MEKKVFWMYKGKEYTGTATLNEDSISITANHNGMVIDHLDKEQENGMRLEEIWDEIPEDITDFELC